MSHEEIRKDLAWIFAVVTFISLIRWKCHWGINYDCSCASLFH